MVATGASWIQLKPIYILTGINFLSYLGEYHETSWNFNWNPVYCTWVNIMNDLKVKWKVDMICLLVCQWSVFVRRVWHVKIAINHTFTRIVTLSVPIHLDLTSRPAQSLAGGTMRANGDWRPSCGAGFPIAGGVEKHVEGDFYREIDASMFAYLCDVDVGRACHHHGEGLWQMSWRLDGDSDLGSLLLFHLHVGYDHISTLKLILNIYSNLIPIHDNYL